MFVSDFKILEHTADVGIIATGNSFESALEETAKGMFSLMGNAKKKEKIEISVERENKDELVVFLLSEILAKAESLDFTPAALKIKSCDDKKISVEIFGEYKTLKNIIKAVTFHMLEVKEEQGKWKIQVLFDI